MVGLFQDNAVGEVVPFDASHSLAGRYRGQSVIRVGALDRSRAGGADFKAQGAAGKDFEAGSSIKFSSLDRSVVLRLIPTVPIRVIQAVGQHEPTGGYELEDGQAIGGSGEDLIFAVAIEVCRLESR